MGIRQAISHGGCEREYFLHGSTPPAGSSVPLVIELHGGGGSGRMIDRLGRFGPLGHATALIWRFFARHRLDRPAEGPVSAR